MRIYTQETEMDGGSGRYVGLCSGVANVLGH